MSKNSFQIGNDQTNGHQNSNQSQDVEVEKARVQIEELVNNNRSGTIRIYKGRLKDQNPFEKFMASSIGALMSSTAVFALALVAFNEIFAFVRFSNKTPLTYLRDLVKK